MINRKILRSVRFVSRFQLLNYEKKMKKKQTKKTHVIIPLLRVHVKELMNVRPFYC